MGHSEGPCITFVLGVYLPDEAPLQAGLPRIESHELLCLFVSPKRMALSSPCLRLNYPSLSSIEFELPKCLSFTLSNAPDSIHSGIPFNSAPSMSTLKDNQFVYVLCMFCV